jgi:hypothetical protein
VGLGLKSSLKTRTFCGRLVRYLKSLVRERKDC